MVIASRLCGFATRLSVRPLSSPIHAADLEEIVIACHQRESRLGVDLAPLFIGADTKIIPQREVRHLTPNAVIEARYLT
jgi:hypothetical protein